MPVIRIFSSFILKKKQRKGNWFLNPNNDYETESHQKERSISHTTFARSKDDTTSLRHFDDVDLSYLLLLHGFSCKCAL